MAHAEPSDPEEFLKIYQSSLQVEKEKAAEALAWPEHPHPELNQRLINMMRSDDPTLKRMGAKRIHYAHVYKTELLTVLNEEIKDQYQNKLSGELLDAVAWMCKALAGSRIIEYKPTIEMVYKGSKEKRLRKHAKKYLRYYGS